MRHRALLVVALLALRARAAPGKGGVPACAIGVAPPPDALLHAPADDWHADAVGVYATIPLSAEEEKRLVANMHQAARSALTIIITVELAPEAPSLPSVLRPETFAPFSRLCDDFATRGLKGCILRLLPEFNGGWFRHGKQPLSIKRAFALAADARDENSTMKILWAPNYGGGYPFYGSDIDGSDADPTELAQLDTDGDGALTARDDPYQPYWPVDGDKTVDLVGLSLYHYGTSYPWSKPHRLPSGGLAPWLGVEAEPHALQDRLFGRYHGMLGDESHVPNFFQAYVLDRQKPFVLAETAAFWVAPEPSPGGGIRGLNLNGASANVTAAEIRIKSSWWKQVFNRTFCEAFPGSVAVLAWFDVSKAEAEAGGRVVDWRAFYVDVDLNSEKSGIFDPKRVGAQRARAVRDALHKHLVDNGW